MAIFSNSCIHANPWMNSCMGGSKKIQKCTYVIYFFPFFRELMHVDDAVDELRDKEKMNYIEAQEKALKKMHIEHNLRKEELMNTLRDFQVQ